MLYHRKSYFIPGITVMLIVTAAFIAGRFLNRRSISSGSVSLTIVPAVELPTTLPEVTGAFVERQDNTLIIETKSWGAHGVAVVSPAARKNEIGPLVEVVVTNETLIYRGTTELSAPLSIGTQTIQQRVEVSKLDDLDARSIVRVWGRKSGDRIIADVLMHSNTEMIKRGLFEDCDVCP
jgi:hypothetical protein